MITFVQALDAITKKHAATEEATACVDALLKAEGLSEHMPTLRRLHRGLAKEYEAAREGSLVIACLAAKQTGAIVAWATPIAPDVWRKYKPEVAERAAKRLYADCFLALDKWVERWNRRDLKRVA